MRPGSGKRRCGRAIAGWGSFGQILGKALLEHEEDHEFSDIL